MDTTTYLMQLAAQTAVLAATSEPDDTADDKPACTACGWQDEDDLLPGLNDDPYCGDCLTAFADHDDAAEWRAYAYS